MSKLIPFTYLVRSSFVEPVIKLLNEVALFGKISFPSELGIRIIRLAFQIDIFFVSCWVIIIKFFHIFLPRSKPWWFTILSK
jgi:hypothetical protein